MKNSDPLKLTVLDYDTDETVTLPSTVAVCDRCNGSGVHDHPAVSNGISGSEFDEDFRVDYMRGNYDVTCSECGGLRVIAAPDLERFTPRHHELWNNHCQARSGARAEQRMREQGIEF